MRSDGTLTGGGLRAAACAAVLMLAGCGGGDTPPTQGSTSCEPADQQDWLRNYMRDWYYWADRAPDPAPSASTPLADYFEARRFRGDATTRGDVWSFYQDSTAYNQFYAEGETLGYGLFVNGAERTLPLRVRMVEPRSPAAAAGLKRGDRIVSLNGIAAATLIDGDFALLSPARAGDRLEVVADTAGGRRSLTLEAAVFPLTPVPVRRVLPLAGGRSAGYLMLKDFIGKAEAPLAAAFAEFRAAGASELIVDLRYNGGGRISTATQLASQVVGALRRDLPFVELRYNAAHPDATRRYLFADAPAPAFPRVLVLTGSRTCSASELIVNGLAPYLEVVTLGATTCGKPYGFNSVASCGNTFSIVNFQSFNAAGFGAYDKGLAPTCPVAEDFTRPLGDPSEKLTAAALGYLETGACPASAAAPARAAAAPRPGPGGVEPGDRRGMWAD